MDPQATWDNLVAALRAMRDSDDIGETCDAQREALDSLRALEEWILKGGFPPKVQAP